jgi:recombinational DNA repair ATPase RecF
LLEISPSFPVRDNRIELPLFGAEEVEVVLDDVFAELDQTRRRRLAHAVAGFEQVIITAAVLEDVPEALAAHTIHIRGGAVVDD